MLCLCNFSLVLTRRQTTPVSAALPYAPFSVYNVFSTLGRDVLQKPDGRQSRPGTLSCWRRDGQAGMAVSGRGPLQVSGGSHPGPGGPGPLGPEDEPGKGPEPAPGEK